MIVSCDTIGIVDSPFCLVSGSNLTPAPSVCLYGTSNMLDELTRTIAQLPYQFGSQFRMLRNRIFRVLAAMENTCPVPTDIVEDAGGDDNARVQTTFSGFADNQADVDDPDNVDE